MIESYSGRRKSKRVDGQKYSPVTQLSSHHDAFNGEEEEVTDSEGHEVSKEQVNDDDESSGVKHFSTAFSLKTVKREDINCTPLDAVSDRSSNLTTQADDLSLQQQQQQQPPSPPPPVQQVSSSLPSHSSPLSASPCDTVCSECTSNRAHCPLDTPSSSSLCCTDFIDDACLCCSLHGTSGEHYLASTFYFQPQDYDDDDEDEGEDGETREEEEEEDDDDEEAHGYEEPVTSQVKYKLKRSANWLLRFFSR